MKFLLNTRLALAKTILLAVMLLSVMQTADSQIKAQGTEHGDWTVSCENTPASFKSCAMWQVASTADDAPPLLHVELSFRRPFSDASLLIILPLGISLTSAPTLHIDKKQVMDFQVDYCIADGCYIRSKLTPALLEQLLHMKNAILRLKTFDGHDIELPISGTGSRAAFNSTDDSGNDS